MRLPLPALARRPVTGELRVDAVAAQGPAVRAMMVRLLHEDDDRLAALRGVAGPEVAVVLGEDLPWFEGAIHLCRTHDEPGLLLPTGVVSPLPAALLLTALRAQHPGLVPPVAALPTTRHVVPLAAARPLERARLRRCLESLP